jgi:hypothetical protein
MRNMVVKFETKLINLINKVSPLTCNCGAIDTWLKKTNLFP